MHRFCLLLIGAMLASATSAASPRRIVSLNLCVDQYLLALADRGQIAALTRFARDPEMSAYALRAHGLPISRGTTEEILALEPDLVLTTAGGRAGALGNDRYRIMEVPPANNYADIIAQIRQVAAIVGHQARGEALIARMNADLAELDKERGHGIAAYYQRRGYMTGTGTLVDDLMTRVGLTNLAGRLGKPSLSRITLEEMVAARPDYLIVETATDTPGDRGTEMLHHPILNDIPRLRLPEAWTVCGSPAYVSAARSLLRQMQRR